MKRISVSMLIILFVFGLFSSTAYAVSPSVSEGILSSTLEISKIPNFTDEPYIVINNNVPDFFLWQISSEPYIVFSPFDDLGRTGAGMACLGKETLPTVARGEIGNIRPTGWHTVRYDDLIEDRYLYNRAHVIGYMLSGDNNTPENLFTGTRYLNTGAMLQFETSVVAYIEKTGNHVIYRVTPEYWGQDLVATGVQMEAYSVEDNGAGICFNVFVYNVQPGILIDYRTGESERDLDFAPGSATSPSPLLGIGDDESEASSVPDRSLQEPSDSGTQTLTEPIAITYVLNTNTMKFHSPSCPSVADMKAKNRQDFYGTRDEAIAAGYSPCGRCHP